MLNDNLRGPFNAGMEIFPGLEQGEYSPVPADSNSAAQSSRQLCFCPTDVTSGALSNTASSAAQAAVVQQIFGFNQIVDQRTAQILAAYGNGSSTPAALQNDLNNYANPPGGTDLEELQVKQGALANIENYVAGQLKTEIQGEVAAIIATSSRQELLAFSGLLTQTNISDQPGAVGSAAEKVGQWAIGKFFDWALGEASDAVQWVMGRMTISTTTALTEQTQGAINQQLRQLPNP